eukprot:COSAG03_NODE_57_length_15795_cov_83.762784_2_plen_75_part_00
MNENGSHACIEFPVCRSPIWFTLPGQRMGDLVSHARGRHQPPAATSAVKERRTPHHRLTPGQHDKTTCRREWLG